MAGRIGELFRRRGGHRVVFEKRGESHATIEFGLLTRSKMVSALTAGPCRAATRARKANSGAAAVTPSFCLGSSSEVGRRCEMPIKRASAKAKPDHVSGQRRKPAKMFRAGLYARVSSNDQQTLAMQSRAMREYAARRGWTIALQVREVNSGAAQREAR